MPILGGETMKKKMSRLLRPGLIACFVVMFLFAAAAVWLKQYHLAIVEFAVTALLMILYLLDRKRRNREIMSFVQSAFHTEDLTAQGAESPLPMAFMEWCHHMYTILPNTLIQCHSSN